MAKAILVMNMPENCFKCRLHSSGGYKDKTIIYCHGADKEIAEWFENNGGYGETYPEEVFLFCKPAWCPLQEPIIYKDIEKYEKDEYKGGWNDAMFQIGAVTMEEAYPWRKEE